MPPLTHDLDTAAELLGAPSRRWLLLKLRAGTLPGRKIGRFYRMTDEDIQESLEILSTRNKPKPPAPQVSNANGLTATSAKRIAEQQTDPNRVVVR